MISQEVGTFKCWGVNNKEAPINLVVPFSEKDNPLYFQIRSLDHTANMLIAFALIIINGCIGIE